MLRHQMSLLQRLLLTCVWPSRVLGRIVLLSNFVVSTSDNSLLYAKGNMSPQAGRMHVTSAELETQRFVQGSFQNCGNRLRSSSRLWIWYCATCFGGAVTSGSTRCSAVHPSFCAPPAFSAESSTFCQSGSRYKAGFRCTYQRSSTCLHP